MTNKYENLTFFRQRIVRKVGLHMIREGEEYELLLRNNNDDHFAFPTTIFEEAIINHLEHTKYLKRIKELLGEILQNCSGVYSINIDAQELYYDETFNLFDQLKKFRKKLKIELTENLPYKRKGEYSSQFPLEQVIKLHKLGYEIVLDDFLCGINGLDKLLVLSPYISRVKVSKLNFNSSLSDAIFYSFVQKSEILIHEINPELSFVIEAEETERVLIKLPDTWLYQTYYFDKPSKITHI